MKKILYNIMAVFTIMLILLIQLPVKANTNENKIILQKEEKEFIIYYKNICNKPFNFAFSTNKEEQKESLVFIASVEDMIQDEKLNTAYINESIFNKYFKDNDKKTYIWIKDHEGKYLIEADLIDLSEDVMTDKQIEYVDNTSKRIEGEERNSSITNIWTDKDGVKHTVILSQYVISMDENTEYYYQMVKIPKDTTTGENARLYELADKLQKGVDSKYEQFELQKEFYNLYNSLYPKIDDSAWIKTEDGYIVEPEDTITGDRYIIWLKAVKGEEITKDVKFLLCHQEDAEEKEKFTPMEEVELPKTYDSKALLIIFAGIIVLIIIILILRSKTEKKENS